MCAVLNYPLQQVFSNQIHRHAMLDIDEVVFRLHWKIIRPEWCRGSIAAKLFEKLSEVERQDIGWWMVDSVHLCLYAVIEMWRLCERFCIYIDDLLLTLSRSRAGCFINNDFVGALAYADDIVLIAPTTSALRKLLSTCGDYASEYCICFNADKSMCLVILPKKRHDLHSCLNECRFTINSQPIENVESFKHLGHVISSQMEDAADITNRRNDFVGQVNNLLCYFRKLTSHVKYILFRSYCTSFLGCELCSLLSNNLPRSVHRMA
jgi:hypothetical protein